MKFILCLCLMCFTNIVMAMTSQLREAVDPLDRGFLEGSSLKDVEYGLNIEKPGKKWEWYRSKKSTFERDYILLSENDDFYYVIGLDRRKEPISKDSMKLMIQGAKEEALAQGFELVVTHTENTNIHNKNSFLFSSKVISNNGELIYESNIHVTYSEGLLVTIIQYPREGFGIEDLKELSRSIRFNKSEKVLLPKNGGNYYYNLGRLFARYLMALFLILVLIILIKSMIKGENK